MPDPFPPLRRALGLAVRRLRADAGWSQDAFAAHAGVHRTYVGSVERGEVNVSLDNLQRIARALDVPVSVLLAEAEVELLALPDAPKAPKAGGRRPATKAKQAAQAPRRGT